MPPELDDAEHEEILKNPEADRALADRAIQRAISRGLDKATARKLYAYREPEPQPDVKTLNRIAAEITNGTPPARPDTELEAAIRKRMTREIEEAKERGMIIELVSE